LDGHGSVTSRAPETRASRQRGLITALLIAAALALWSFFFQSSVASVRSVDHSKLAAAKSTARPLAVQGPAPRRLPLPPAAPVPSAQPSLTLVDVATDGLPYMPAAPDAKAATGPVHPHPLTPEHARIFRENATIQALNDAMDSQDAKAMRGSLLRYRLETPEDSQQLQQGYELIVDCLEGRPGYREAARRYFDEETASSLRRFVLRHCLGGP
jgi:hypothetical protein